MKVVANRITILSALSIAFAAFMLLLAPSSVAAAANGASGSHYVDYSVTMIGPNQSTHSASINESVAPSGTSGLSTLSVQLISSMSNLSYSKIVNSSMAMFPILPSIANQSFAYSFHNFSISASVTKVGTGSASIDGSAYTLTNYAFSVTGSWADGAPMSASGQFSTLPSGLLYSAAINGPNQTSATVKLVATNLPLDSSQLSNTTGMAIVGGAGTAVAAGVGAFALYKRKNGADNGGVRRNQEEGEEEKPLYHVD